MPERTPAARLSRMLFEARELADMYGDILKARGLPSSPGWPHRLRDEIDAYRSEQGWSPDGFGGES